MEGQGSLPLGAVVVGDGMWEENERADGRDEMGSQEREGEERRGRGEKPAFYIFIRFQTGLLMNLAACRTKLQNAELRRRWSAARTYRDRYHHATLSHHLHGPVLGVTTYGDNQKVCTW